MEPNDANVLIRAIAEHSQKIGAEPSELARNKMIDWHKSGVHETIERPSWTDTYLSMAHTLAKRSHDAQSQNGCVIVSPDMKPLSWGYNGFPAGIWDDILPNTRPAKYPWMLHSELNAILNATSSLRGGIIYVTGHPCLHCYMCICAVGISEIIYDSSNTNIMVEGDEEMMAHLDVVRWLTSAKIKVTPYDFRLTTTGE